MIRTWLPCGGGGEISLNCINNGRTGKYGTATAKSQSTRPAITPQNSTNRQREVLKGSELNCKIIEL